MVAARKLLRRAGRDRAGRFLVEGAQAVREALSSATTVHELLLTEAAAQRHPELVEAAPKQDGRNMIMVLAPHKTQKTRPKASAEPDTN